MPALTHCKHMVSGLFHRPFGLLFTFPSRYQFTIGFYRYLALPVSSGRFPQAIRVLRYSRMTIKELDRFKIQDYHLLWFFFPEDSSNSPIFYSLSPSASCSIAQAKRARKITIILQPRYSCEYGLGFFAFARRYLRNSVWFLFLQVLRCFTSLGMQCVIKLHNHPTLLG